MTKMTEERKTFFHYMFTTGIEGATGHWAAVAEYHWWKKDGKGLPDLDGFFAILESEEDDWGVEEAFIAETGEVQPITETQSLRVDVTVLERGWNLFMDKVIEATKEERSEHNPSGEFSNSYFKLAVVQYLTDMEDGDSDATVADIVFQLGLFGEHVYS